MTYNNIKLDVLIHNAKRDAAKTSLYVLTFQNYFLLEITTAAAAIAMGRTARTIPVSAGVVSAAGAGVLSSAEAVVSVGASAASSAGAAVVSSAGAVVSSAAGALGLLTVKVTLTP